MPCSLTVEKYLYTTSGGGSIVYNDRDKKMFMISSDKNVVTKCLYSWVNTFSYFPHQHAIHVYCHSLKNNSYIVLQFNSPLLTIMYVLTVYRLK
jgi:hypothetical protein